MISEILKNCYENVIDGFYRIAKDSSIKVIDLDAWIIFANIQIIGNFAFRKMLTKSCTIMVHKVWQHKPCDGWPGSLSHCKGWVSRLANFILVMCGLAEYIA